jgi:release factor glutamine methyltransferase
VNDPVISSHASTVQGTLEQLAAILTSSRVEDPARSASDIIAALLEVPRSWPKMNRDASLEPQTLRAAYVAAERLDRGAPFAYAVGAASFRHLNLIVDERVLIPRPETEVLVGEILDRMESRSDWGTAIDIGTGSGAIALSLASEGRFKRVIATDTSNDALTVAGINAKRSVSALKCDVEFRHGSFLAPVRDVKATVVVSNPPYVTFDEAQSLPQSVRDWEPAIALFSGHDGLTATRRIVRQSVNVLESNGLLALEVDERRASLVAELIMQTGAYRDVGVRLDLAGRERFVLAARV